MHVDELVDEYDPRIVALYDADNDHHEDNHYFHTLSTQDGVRSIVDLGCGTGCLTVKLGSDDTTVVGVDPSAAMLNFAKRRPMADRVQWAHGDSTALPASPADLVMMSGNVAQRIQNPEWQRTLNDIAKVLSPSGTLAFGSRNPAARAWERWHQPEHTTRSTPFGPLEEWNELTEDDGLVNITWYSKFLDAGDTVIHHEPLRFRTCDDMEAHLAEAGLKLTNVWGDWRWALFDGTQPEMIFEAQPR